MVINEILFNEPGVDSLSGGEAIELYAASAITNLAAYSVESVSGSFNLQLPQGPLSQGTYVLIFLGNHVPPGYQSIVTTGVPNVAIAAGLPLGDHLSNTLDGVRLRKNGRIRDEVSWGVNALPAGAAPARNINIAFGTGTPMRPGETLGRSKSSSFTNSAADWSASGGRNASGATLGSRNVPDLPGASELHLWAQSGLNQIFAGLSIGTAQVDWLQMTDASVGNVQVDDDVDWIETTGTHTLTIDVFGNSKIFFGDLTARLDRSTVPGSIGLLATVSGILTAADGTSFEIRHSEHRRGFQSTSLTNDVETDFSWTQNGQTYSTTLDVQIACEQVGQYVYQLRDSRDATDWGGAGVKHSETVMDYVETQDGVSSSMTVVERPREMMPPPLAQAGSQNITADALLRIDSTWTLRPDLSSSTVSRFDYSENGALLTTLAAGQAGSASEGTVVDSQGIATVTSQWTMPVQRAGEVHVLSTLVNGTAGVFGNKTVIQGTYALTLDGSTLSREFFADPPTLQDSDRTFGGFVGAVADCGTPGAAIGGGVGAIGGAVVGGVVGGVAAAGATAGTGVVMGAAAGAGGGAVGGAAIGAGLGGLAGAIGCGGAWLCGLWDWDLW
jgi:hypothetical protein